MNERFSSDNATEQIKNRIRLSSFISRYLRVEEKGRKKVALCPFHDDHNPSMQIDDERGSYKCWSCGASGDVFSFLMQVERIDFKSALEKLAGECNIILHSNQAKNTGVLKEKKQKLYQIYSILAQELKNYLLSDAPDAVYARKYLSERCVDSDAIERFSIGWAPDDKNYIFNLLTSKGFDSAAIYSSGLFSQKGWPYFADGRIMLPIMDESSRPVAFSARTLKSDKNIPKYINSSESLIFKKSENFFALAQSLESIRKKNPIIICEGNFDAIALHSAGLMSAIASCGTAFTDEHVTVLKRLCSYADNLVYIFPDKDAAGIKASFKWIEKLVSSSIKVKVISTDDFSKDAAEAVCKNGADYMKKCFDNAQSDIEYILSALISSADIQEGIHYTKAIVEKFKWYYDALPTLLEKDSLEGFLSQKLNVSKKNISQVLREGSHIGDKNQFFRINNSVYDDNGFDFNSLPPSPYYEMDLVNTLLCNRKYFDSEYLEGLNYNDFKCKKAKILYALLCNMPQGQVEDDESFLSSVSDENQRKYIQKLIDNGNGGTDNAKILSIINDSMHMIKRAKTQEQIEQFKVLGEIDDGFNTIVMSMIAENKKR